MTGFFTKEQIISKSRPDGKLLSCTSCGLLRKANTPRFQPIGNFQKEIMIIGEMPSKKDDLRGELLQGRSGQFLKMSLKAIGIDLFDDCIYLNAINCYSEDENSPTKHEIDCCRRIVMHTIEEHKPKLIILFGISAVVSVIGNRWKKDIGTIDKWRGWNIPDQNLKTWVCPMETPEIIVNVNSEKNVDDLIWKQDLSRAITCLKKQFLKYIEPEIEVLENLDEISDVHNYKNEVMVSHYAAFDYETTGLKPHDNQHQIVCASIANNENHAWVFMIPESRRDKQPFIEFLKNKNIMKIAHNMKFEIAWSVNKLKTEPVPFTWDTMLAAHVIDNRPSVKSLKFQTFVNFGIVDYASEITPFLESTEKSGNGHNRVLELIETKEGKDKLLKYCAMDSIFEYRLAMLQMPLLLPKTPRL